jgi:hypothetical protein
MALMGCASGLRAVTLAIKLLSSGENSATATASPTGSQGRDEASQVPTIPHGISPLQYLIVLAIVKEKDNVASCPGAAWGTALRDA